ncbi:MAG: ABC-F family ATP-binding cassette domain-containing protein [Saprospiraceae bacterium]|nr:ABC-F family ATP-binding cassette domain-containing protein [Saprospiraceae bacterium]MDW8229439.1 ABC-F family ATP-binding cassette domain-containing protein [Saprospiraceae bacterium]
MLTLNNIYVQYGDRVLMDHINLVVKPGERIGLVGRNGAGKSTLLKIIANEMLPHEGQVIKPAHFTIGYLHQDMLLPKGKTVLDEAMTAFVEVLELEKQLQQVQDALAQRDDYESDDYARLLEHMSDITERLHHLGQATTSADAERVLTGLGFRHSDMTRMTDELSGGWQMRVELAKILLRQPDLILLDEPTNHLDIESILWLEDWLNKYSGMLIVISHDRRFLDNVTNRTVEIVLGRLEDYKAPYSKYVELSADRREKLQAAYENQQRLIADRERTINRFMAKATKTRAAQSMQKQLDKMERIEIEEQDTAVMRLRFPDAPRSGEVVARAERLSKRYGAIKVLENVDLQILRGERVAFVGQNGQGKTTLAKMLIGLEPPTSGQASLGYNVSVGYYAQNQAETLNPRLTLLETMEQHSPPEMRTRLRAILGAFLFSGEDVDKKVAALSGGERARLALACMLLKPFNFLVLDEPTNHLDMLSKDVLKQALLDYNGTLLVVSHDREFLSGLTTRTIEFRDGQLREYLGDVNYFLEKRQLDNMRQVELRSPQPSRAADSYTAPDQQIKAGAARTPEEKKQLQRQVQRAEKRIAEIEAELKQMEELMGHTDFYARPDHQQTLERYRANQAELERCYAEWEAAAEQLS